METAVVQSCQDQPNTMTEDSSDRSDVSSTISQEPYHSRNFDDYDIVTRLKDSVGERCTTSELNELQTIARSKEPFGSTIDGNIDTNDKPRINSSQQQQLDEVQSRQLSLNHGKSKEYDYSCDALNYQMDRTTDIDKTSQICHRSKDSMKEAFFNIAARQKYLAASYDRSPKEFNYLVEREIKEYGEFAKGYNLTVDRMKDINVAHERTRENHCNGFASRERLTDAGINESSEHRNVNVQSRGSQDLECIVYERMRRPNHHHQHHFLNRMDFGGQNLTTAPHCRQTSLTQMQQSQQQQQQQQLQQQQQQQPQRQIKSFTIDAILAHRNNQRERHQRNQQQQLRKATRVVRQECQEIATKNGTRASDTSVNDAIGVVNSGKAKRVRTIFTPEQLERLEGEFARQQYMVGPERLYLAHALRLTEAQVKVWFQNRRIKWRKVNHEQQCQAVSEHRQRCSLTGGGNTLEIHEIHEDDSNDTSNVNWCVNSAITATSSSDDTSMMINAGNQQQRDIRDSTIVKS